MTQSIHNTFTIAIDTREQKPYTFRGMGLTKDSRKPLIIPTVAKCLATGDYSIEGLEDQIAIERKSKPDLYQSLGTGRKRLRREFERMEDIPFSAILVEADWQGLTVPLPQTRISPRMVINTVLSWSIRYNTHWILAANRHLAERICFRLLEIYWRKHRGTTHN